MLSSLQPVVALIATRWNKRGAMLLIDTYLILALAILFFVKIKLRQFTSLLLLYYFYYYYYYHHHHYYYIEYYLILNVINSIII